MNIGEAADAAGVAPKTIRYWESVGLAPQPARRDSGYRDYDARDIHVLRFLARARGAGFSVDETRQLLALWQDRDRAAADVKRLTEERIAAIDAKILELEEMRAALAHLAHACHGGTRPDCPILEGLAGEGSR